MDGDDDRRLAGIGGWLAFFLIVIGVLSPLRIVYEIVTLTADAGIAAAFAETWAVIAPGEWLLSAVQLGICFFIVWRLVKVRSWRTVRIVIAGIWIANIAVPAAELLLVAFAAGFPLGELVAAAGPELVRAPIFAAIWTAYFLRSERVANTYPRSGDTAEMAEVFS